MGKTVNIVAWMCLFSTLCVGCTSTSVTIVPTGKGKAQLCSETIYSVVTKDSTMYIFEKPPTVVNDTIVGELRSIAVSDVAYASTPSENPGLLIPVGVLVLGMLALGFLGGLFTPN